MLRLINNNECEFKETTCFRAVIDPTSNPDPITNGLLIPIGGGVAQIELPFTVIQDPGLGACTPYITDPDNLVQVQPTKIVLPAGEYQISVNLSILGTDPTQVKILEVLLDGQQIFMAPPIVFGGSNAAITINMPPYTAAWELSGSANCKLLNQETIILAIILNNIADINVITLNSNLSLIKIN